MPPLSPRWKIDFAVPGATGDTPYFDPVVVEERGVLVAGGPLAISVFTVTDRARLWYTVKAHVSITGFSATASALYVQDGPVLSGWNLTEHRCFAAVNLVTEVRWELADDQDLQLEPPDDLFELPEEAAGLQTQLLSRTLLGAASYADGVHAVPEARHLVFSAPQVRKLQFDGAGGRVFSVSMDGLAVAMTSELDVSFKLSHEVAPLRAELTLVELPQPGGKTLCYLYYVGRDGSIVALDASDELKRQPAHWGAKGTPVPERVLPLQYHGGLLFGGGILGADFFVLELDPSAAPRNTAAGDWKRYSVSVEDQFVIVYGPSSSRLVSYAKGVGRADRWGERRFASPACSDLWTGTGHPGDLSEAKLAVEIDIAAPSASGDPAFRILLANTVDCQPPRQPPIAAELFSTTLAGLGGAMPHITKLLSIPIIRQQGLYFVARASVNGVVKDVLLCYSIGPIATEVAASALQQLAKHRKMANSLPVLVMMHKAHVLGKGTPFANRTIKFINADRQPPFSRIFETYQTDAEGYVFIDSPQAHRWFWVDFRTPFPDGGEFSSSSAVVISGSEPLTIDFALYYP